MLLIVAAALVSILACYLLTNNLERAGLAGMVLTVAMILVQIALG